MKILQKIKEWKLNRPESQWSKKKLAIAGAALVVAVGLVIGGKILVDHWPVSYTHLTLPTICSV